MMILVNCGCCGAASGYGCAVRCTYGATHCWCTRNWQCTVRGGATHVLTVIRLLSSCFTCCSRQIVVVSLILRLDERIIVVWMIAAYNLAARLAPEAPAATGS